MYNLLLLAALAATSPASTAQQQSVAVIPAKVEKDAKCLTLALIGASLSKDDPDKMKSAIAESWYFLGRMDAIAAGQDLKALLTHMAEQLQNDPQATKALGASCDALFVGRAADLRNLSKQSEKASP